MQDDAKAEDAPLQEDAQAEGEKRAAESATATGTNKKAKVLQRNMTQ